MRHSHSLFAVVFNVYCNSSLLHLGKGQRTYHCQFFGNDAERSWVAESMSIKFEGREAFLAFVEKAKNSAGTKAQRKQICQKYEVSESVIEIKLDMINMILIMC